MVEFTISLPADADGYVTFQCPFCNSRFKLKADEYNDKDKPFDDLCCPYCGLTQDKGHFFTDEVVDAAESIAQNYAAELINESLGKMAKGINTRSCIKMTYTPMQNKEVKKLNEDETEEIEYGCPYCDRHFKVGYCIGESRSFCPYCGVDLL